MLTDPVVTIDRKTTVRLALVVVALTGVGVLIGTLLIFGGQRVGNVHRLMLCLIGMLIAGVCAAAFFWIRSRWLIVAVIDENGLLGNTSERSYDLAWEDMVGARTRITYPKNSVVPHVHVLLLLEGERCLESTIRPQDRIGLLQILEQAEFKKDAEGQKLGVTKGTLLFVLGVLTCMIGVWWIFVLKQQFDAGTLFRGNSKLILIKLALGILGPTGGLALAFWSLYHIVARPVLYTPGWRPSHSWFK
jgi:hypothetical protein